MRRIGAAAQGTAWILLNIVQSVVLALWSTVCVIIAAFSRLFGKDAPLHIARFWSRPLLWLGGVRLDIEYAEEIDWKKPHIFLMNHQSMFDIIAAFLAIKAPLRFIAKKVLAHVPFLGWYMRATGMIFVDRARSAQAIASIKRAGVRVREGASIIAFPEGTRTRDGKIHPFKKGVFMVALEAQVPIVPIAIEGAGRVLPRDGFRLRPGRVRMKVGKPIPTEGLGVPDRDALIERVRDEIVALHVAIGGQGSVAVSLDRKRDMQQSAEPTEEPSERMA